MRIVLNVAAASWLGGHYYLENLALALGRLPPEQRPELAVNGPLDLPSGLASAVEGVPPEWDVVFPNWGLPRGVRAAQMHWIPDLQHRALPGNFTRVDRLRRDVGYRRLIRRAHTVVVSSESVAADVRAAYPTSSEKLRILHFRTVISDEALAADVAGVLSRLGVPDRYILLPNQFWAHKNHATAFAALDRLPLPLVCTGEPHDHRRPGYAESLLAAARHKAPADQLHVLGVVDRADYLQLVRGATAVLQPSLFEGWSSIVEDARAFGRPIALSNIGVHREQAPEHGVYFAPEDPDDLARAVADAVEDGGEPEREAHERQTQRAREYAEHFLRLARAARGAL